MKSKNRILTSFLFVSASLLAPAWGDSYTDVTATGAWNTARWNNSSDASPYASTYTTGNAVQFTSGSYSFAGMGATINVGNVTLADNVTVNFASISNTYATGGNVRTITTGTGSLFDLQGQAISTAVGTGFIKNGAGVWALGGATYTGGFTLNAGTVIARGVNAMGGNNTTTGTTQALTINGGAIGANSTRSFAGKYGGGITIGGDFQLGVLSTAVSIALSTANLTFDNNVNLGGANRKITIGGQGTYALGGGTAAGVISNGGITVERLDGCVDGNNAGTLMLGGNNTYTGGLTVNSGRVSLAHNSAAGPSAYAITLNQTGTIATELQLNTGLDIANPLTVSDTGGIKTIRLFGTTPSATYSGQIELLESGGGNFVVQTGTGANLTISGNIIGSAGAGLKRISEGTLTLTGTGNTFKGPVTINQGTITVGPGSSLGDTTNSLEVSCTPSGAGAVSVLNLDTTADSTVGSLSGSIANVANTATINVATSRTLTVNQTADKSYAGTVAGAGSFTLGSLSTHALTLSASCAYTGVTTINAGKLVMGDASADTFATSGVTVASGATLGGAGTLTGSLAVSGGVAPGTTGIGTLTAGATTWNGGTDWKFNLSNTDNTSDRLVISSGDFTKGSGSSFVFDFLGSSAPAWGTVYTLVTWAAGTTTFADTDFSFKPGSLGVAYPTGSFSISGTSLLFTAVPEPTTALAGLLLGAALLRRRR